MTENKNIFPEVFNKSSLAGIDFKNRIIRAATHEGMADAEGYPSQQLTDLYIRLAKGGAGAIITGYAGVQKNGKPLNNMLMIDEDRFIDHFKKMNHELKKYGVPVILQIAHGGGKSDTGITKEKNVAPSEKKYPMPPNTARELTHREIELIVESFVNAIVRAREAGFSGVELHAAHGYLLSEFLSPAFNKRTDIWGGNTENRFRIISEIIRGAREKTGRFPILMKYSAYDGDKNGVRINEGIRIAKMFEQTGGDALEISCGGVGDGSYPLRFKKTPSRAIVELTPALKDMHPLKKRIIQSVISLTFKSPKPLHNFNLNAAAEIKKHVNIPLIVVGGIRDFGSIEKIIAAGGADYVSMSRPFIIEPDIVNKFSSSKQNSSRCIDCGYCLIGTVNNPLKCYYGKLK